MTWTKKSTTTMKTREMRLEKLQLVIDEQSPLRIKPGQLDISGEAKTARSLRTPEPPTDAARMAHNATHMLHSEIGAQFVLQVVDEVLRHRRVVVNKTADKLPRFQTDYMFIRTVEESKSQPYITFVE